MAGVIFLYALAGLHGTYGVSGHAPGVNGTIAIVSIYNETYAWALKP